MRTKTNICSL